MEARSSSSAVAWINKCLRILLIDDDVEYCQLLSAFLVEAGHEVEACHDGRTGLGKLTRGQFDIILLDVTMMPIDGFATLHQLRRISDAPVLMLTSRTASSERVRGLDAGADDYICKPCDPDELISRLRAAARRSRRSSEKGARFRIGEYIFDANVRELRFRNALVNLTSFEKELLWMLFQARGRTVSREAIAIQDRPLDAFDRSLDVHISHLRSKMRPEGAAIQTVRGVGYVLTNAEELP
jgi:two-component system response regulator CpxR